MTWEQDRCTEALAVEKLCGKAAAALPVDDESDLESVYAALEWWRLRLRQDQQVPEWAGVAEPISQSREIL
jgi:hypothetical protein